MQVVNEIKKNKEQQIFDIALLAGTILMTSGAESYRVEDAVERILSLSEHQERDALALLTSLTVTLKLKDGTTLTTTKRIKSNNVDLHKIDVTNDISRKLASNTIELEEAYQILIKLDQEQQPLTRNMLFKILIGAFFTLMVSGNWISILFSALAVVLTLVVDYLMSKVKLASFVNVLLQAFVAALFTGLMAKLIKDIQISKVLTGALMVLFPGTTLTNAIRDVINGDYITGAGNILSTLMTASALAIGVGLALAITGVSY